MAQSQSPPPAVWSGKPRKLDADPSCVTRKALQPAGTPIGAMTKDRPNLSVRMLGSAALPLPLSKRFTLNAAGEGEAERARPLKSTATSSPVAAVAPDVIAALTGLAASNATTETTRRNTVTDGSARGCRIPPPPEYEFWPQIPVRSRRVAGVSLHDRCQAEDALAPSLNGQPVRPVRLLPRLEGRHRHQSCQQRGSPMHPPSPVIA